MKIREEITTSRWVDGSGWSTRNVDFNVAEFDVDEEQLNAEKYDWNWLENEDLEEGEDVLFKVKYIDPETDEVLATWEDWLSEIMAARK